MDRLTRRIMFAALLAAPAWFLQALFAQAPNQTVRIAAASVASSQPGMPPPGSLAAIYCTGLVGVSGVTQASQIPFPTTLAGVRVSIGGAFAPILAVADLGYGQQINVQVPMEATTDADGTYNVVIQTTTETAQANLAARSAVGDFFQNLDGSGVFQHASGYSLVTPQHPAHAGETVVAYLTAISAGALAPTNTPGPFAPLAYVPQYSDAAGADQYFLQVNGADASSNFFGLAPGLIGIYQMNFVVPQISFSGATARVVLVHYTCSGNFFGTCGTNNGHPASAASAAVTLPLQ